MKTKQTTKISQQIIEEREFDSSIDDAKWLLGSVALIATLVFASGVAASVFGA